MDDFLILSSILPDAVSKIATSSSLINFISVIRLCDGFRLSITLSGVDVFQSQTLRNETRVRDHVASRLAFPTSGYITLNSYMHPQRRDVVQIGEIGGVLLPFHFGVTPTDHPILYPLQSHCMNNLLYTNVHF